MATFEELKNKIKFNKKSDLDVNKILENNDELIPNQIFEIEEARYMLNLIANSDFKGRDIQIVYNIALKLQDILQTIKD